jgi:hypothetical protein
LLRLFVLFGLLHLLLLLLDLLQWLCLCLSSAVHLHL